MEILRNGSSVALNDRDQVEKLIFTAKELAVAATNADGFVNSAAHNQSLAGEMWQGAGFVCGQNEEALLKNIFLSNFLRGLAEAPKRATQVEPVVGSSVENVSVESPESVAVHDEVSATRSSAAAETPTIADHPPHSYSEECVPEGERELVLAEAVDDPWTDDVETIVDESVASATSASDSAAPSADSNIGDGESTETAVTLIPSIVLAENEPYDIDVCTITAVVQLFPRIDGCRKCVISIRTHEFPPEVSMNQIDTINFASDLNTFFDAAIVGYGATLPRRGAEKEKAIEAAKNKEATAKAAATSKKKAAAKPSNEKAKAAKAEVAVEQAKDQASLFAG